MSRKLIGSTTLAAFLLAVMVILAVLMGGFQRQYQAERAIREYVDQLSALDAETVKIQRNLARWYNYCVSVKTSQTGFQEAYGQILNISGGMMGYLSFSDRSLKVPIYHNASQPEGTIAAGHVPGSALPLGGLGNHTVLTVPEELCGLTEGDIFCIHIPGDVLYYCVREVKAVSPGQTAGVLPVAGEDLCTLTIPAGKTAGAEKIMIHGIRREEAHTEKEPVIVRELLHNALLAALATLFLPVITGIAGWIVRKGNCKTSTKLSR